MEKQNFKNQLIKEIIFVFYIFGIVFLCILIGAGLGWILNIHPFTAYKLVLSSGVVGASIGIYLVIKRMLENE